MNDTLLSIDQQNLLNIIKKDSPYGVLRALLSPVERCSLKRLLTLRLVKKGVADLKGKPVAYFFNE